MSFLRKEKESFGNNKKPAGNQPRIIAELVNVIQALNKPTLIISYNKTLAGQLYGEMKEFFPENVVEYFVSY